MSSVKEGSPFQGKRLAIGLAIGIPLFSIAGWFLIGNHDPLGTEMRRTLGKYRGSTIRTSNGREKFYNVEASVNELTEGVFKIGISFTGDDPNRPIGISYELRAENGKYYCNGNEALMGGIEIFARGSGDEFNVDQVFGTSHERLTFRKT